MACVVWLLAQPAQGCSCVIFDPGYILRTSDFVFVGEITGWTENAPLAVTSLAGPAQATRFTYRITESLKGADTSLPLLALGPPSSCEFRPIVGKRYLFTLAKDQTIVGLCQASIIVESEILALRAAATAKP